MNKNIFMMFYLIIGRFTCENIFILGACNNDVTASDKSIQCVTDSKIKSSRCTELPTGSVDFTVDKCSNELKILLLFVENPV